MEQNRKVTLAVLAACLSMAMVPVAIAGDGSVKPTDEKAVKLAPPDSKAVKLNPAESKSVKLNPADSKAVKLNPADANAVKLDPAAQKVNPAGK